MSYKETIIRYAGLFQPNYKKYEGVYQVYQAHRVSNCAIWFLKLPHSEAKEQLIFNVNILGGSSSVLELLETIGNSVQFGL